MGDSTGFVGEAGDGQHRESCRDGSHRRKHIRGAFEKDGKAAVREAATSPDLFLILLSSQPEEPEVGPDEHRKDPVVRGEWKCHSLWFPHLLRARSASSTVSVLLPSWLFKGRRIA